MKSGLAFLLLVILLAAPLATLRAAEGSGGEQANGSGTIFKWLNFVLVFGALGYFLRKPLKQAFADQRAAIRGAIEEARQARAHSQQRLAEVEARLARLEQEVEALRQEAGVNAAAEKQRIQEAARREADRILATTRAEIDSTTRAARLELRAYSARLAVSLAEQRLRQQLTPDLHAALFQRFVGGLAAAGAERRR